MEWGRMLSLIKVTKLTNVHEIKVTKLKNVYEPMFFISSPGLLGCDAVSCCGKIPTLQRSMLPPSSPWRWMQHEPLKRWYPVTTQHGVTTQKMEAYHNPTRRHNLEDGGSMDLWNVGILPQPYTASQPRRWRQHGPLKRWYPTTTLHGVMTQKNSAWIFIAVKASNLTFPAWFTKEYSFKLITFTLIKWLEINKLYMPHPTWLASL
jgi:hypothetical protein